MNTIKFQKFDSLVEAFTIYKKEKKKEKKKNNNEPYSDSRI